MDIIKELYYGKINQINTKKKPVTSQSQEKEEKLYDLIKNILSDNEKHYLDDFVDTLYENINNEILENYIQGFKTGLLLGIEASKVDF